MKSILTKILICSLVLSFGLGSAIFWRVDTAKVSLASASLSSGSVITVASQPKAVMPELAFSAVSSICNLNSTSTNNLVQAPGGINLNQIADCFAISMAIAPQLPELSLAQPIVLPDLAVNSGPSWSPNQVAQTAKSPLMPVAVITLVVIAVVFEVRRRASRMGVLINQPLYLPTSLGLAELQVFRC